MISYVVALFCGEACEKYRLGKKKKCGMQNLHGGKKNEHLKKKEGAYAAH